MNYLTNYYKNLSEQLQERVNVLEKMLKENVETPKHNPSDVHSTIVGEIITQHVSKFPHLRKQGTQVPDVKKSEEHIREILNKHPEAPFTSAEKAVEAIHSHAIEANPELEAANFEDAMETSMGADPTEFDWYDDHVMENEAEHAENLKYSVGEAIKKKFG
jgi:hypothetical protein